MARASRRRNYTNAEPPQTPPPKPLADLKRVKALVDKAYRVSRDRAVNRILEECLTELQNVN